jgi:GT2 family glycosyltransferase
MKIDICVLTAGQRPDLLDKCLNSILPYVEKTKSVVYLFGNGTRIENAPNWVSVKSVKDNRGFPGGANAVINAGNNSEVLFVSDDIEFEDGAIERAVRTFKSDSKIGMLGFKLLFQAGTRNPPGKVQHVGHACDLHGNIIHPLMGWSPENPRTCYSGEVFSVTGATFLTRRKLFRACGGFNEAYGKGYFEDVELALNMRDRGYKIWLDAEAVAHHYVGATFEKLGGSDLRANRQLFILNNAHRLVWDTWMRY